MGKIIEYIKNMAVNQDKKKVVENCIIIIIIGIIIVVAGGTIFKKKDKDKGQGFFQDNISDSGQNKETTEIMTGANTYTMEEKLEKILSQISGAGKVSVMITYDSGSEKIPAYDSRKSENNTNETDERGGSREITQIDLEEKIAYEEIQSGIRKPIILKEEEPKIKGVVVVADGGNEPVVKENLVRAVQTLMDISIHKVQVFAREK